MSHSAWWDRPWMVLDLPHPFGRYTLLAALGEGGFGRAFLAAYGRPPRLCVVKLALPDLAPEAAAKFVKEAQMMTGLSCSSIAAFIEAGEHGGERFLTMEFVDGVDLQRVLGRARERKIEVPIAVAVYIAREIVRGLHYLHSHEEARIIHRDVTPANVMIAYSGEVKLIDLGLAKTGEAGTGHAQTIPGRPDGQFGYLAPEHIDGQDYDHRADLYSAGLILWEMLTGEQWFVWPENSKGVVNGTPPRRSDVLPAASSRRADVDQDLDDIVRRSVAPDPAARFVDGETMRRALTRYLASAAPLTDWTAVERFIRPLFGDEIAKGREERKLLLEAAVAGAAELAAVPERVPHEHGGSLGNRRSGEPVLREPLESAAVPGGQMPSATEPLSYSAGISSTQSHRRSGRRIAGAVFVGGAVLAAFLLLRPRPLPPPESRSTAASSPPVALHPIPAVPPPVAEPTRPTVVGPDSQVSAADHAVAVRNPVSVGSGKTLGKHATPELPVAPQLNPPDPEAELNQAQRAFQRAAFDEALGLGRRAIADGGGASAHLLVGNALFRLNRLDDAVREYGEVLKLNPDERMARERLDIIREAKAKATAPAP